MDYDNRKIKVKLYSDHFEFDVNADEVILDAAMRAKIDPPFSCQIGACASCRAMLVSGQVEMECTDALTDDEVKEGFILTCQAHPLTDDVYVDYDQG